MDLVDGTRAVLEELKRQRQEGVDAVYLEQETIDGLRTALGSMESKVAAPVASETKPEPKATPVEPVASSWRLPLKWLK